MQTPATQSPLAHWPLRLHVMPVVSCGWHAPAPTPSQ